MGIRAILEKGLTAGRGLSVLVGIRIMVFILFCSSFTVFAQNEAKLKVIGKITDAQSNSALSYASIRLFKVSDSTFVSGAITDEAGAFTVDIAAGSYYSLAEFIGYKPQITQGIKLTSVNSPLNIGTIKVTASARTLDEVTVQAEKSSMELSLDKKIFNVGKDLANAGGTAVDILTNVPSVAVDVEGNVSLRGSGNVRILIDGKPSGLVSIKGASGLAQLQGSMIERVEIITNPSARYEAEGMGGVINIVLKKERKEGINGSFDIITGHPTNYGAAANVNYRRKNLNFFINYTMSYRNTPGKNFLYQELYRNDSTFIMERDMRSNLKGMNNSARGGIDYYFNPKNILTGSYTWRRSKGKRFSNLNYRDYLSNLGNLTGITNRTQDETETEPNAEYSLTYKKTFDRKGRELTADVRYLDNWENSDQYYNENIFKADGSPSGIPPLLQRAVNYETEKQLLFQLDYVHPFGKDGKFEAGARSSTRDMTNDYIVTQQASDGGWITLPALTNDFLYEENINAAYGIVGNKTGKFSYQAGVRAEWTGVTTELKQTRDVNERKYANLFPSMHITYDFAKQNAFQLSFSRRVRRPQYNDLSPFATYSDNRNYWSGNPDLNPEFTNAFELGHIKYMSKGSLTSSVYYRHTNGKITSIRRVQDDGSSYTRPENLGTEDAYGVEFTSSFTPFPWWKMDGSFNFFRAITDGTSLDEDFQSDTYSWFVRAMSRFTLWKSTDVQLRGNYEAPQQTPQGRRKALATLDLAATRDILKNNGTLTLSVIDVFNSRKFRSITEGPNFYARNSSQGRLRQINLTLNYRLHQAKKKPKESLEGEF
ncbi:outer membrane receptor protein involved in Fe transport [Dyadobacter arcticus]|uniref:Outer membrane receptor protein involved in Fe transport n=2 Tax=Dyadobacter arcticus TaxID=1078754 RepID=A0ABX0UN97_9BACT|nr:TonB-dependent receptor [Dyadobacter arcticus]NIJ53130.1 outer membrane receptor protein involved in Fe transport [Dyadobacter arcticus]